MRVLLILCHPVEDSFNAALHRVARAALEGARHQVDDCDLYAEGFDPVLSRQERLDYRDPAINRAPVTRYVERVLAAEALVLCFPVWNFGLPALLKGFFGRVFLPGVSFHLSDEGRIEPRLQHIRKLGAIATYGCSRPVAWYMGDPPRRFLTRALGPLVRPRARVLYLAQYRMNVATETARKRFLAKVERAMARF